MKKSVSRVLGIFLLCALLFSLSSCLIVINRPPDDTTGATGSREPSGGTTAPTPGEDDTLSADERAALALRSMVDYPMNGKTIILASADSSVPQSASGTSILDGARWRVLNEVQEKYDVSLIVTNDTSNNMLQKLREAKATGLYYADILLPESATLGRFFAERLISDLSQMPFLTMNAAYYNAASLASASIDGKIYGFAGDAGLDPEIYRCLYVNEGVARSLGLTGLYETVEQGSWTLDAMLTAAKAARDSENACGGILSKLDDTALSLSFFEGSGTSYIGHTEDGFSFYSPVGAPQIFVERMRELWSDGLYGYHLTEEEKEDFYDETLGEYYQPEEYELFRSGRSLFFFGILFDTRRFWNAPDVITPLPIPKTTGEQERYVTPTAGQAMLFAVPSGSQSMAEVSLLIEALNVRAHNCLSEAYLETYFTTFSRNERSVDLLSLILENPYFDLAVNWNSQYELLARGTEQTILQAITTGGDLLDIHFANYYNALGALEAIRGDAY